MVTETCCLHYGIVIVFASRRNTHLNGINKIKQTDIGKKTKKKSNSLADFWGKVIKTTSSQHFWTNLSFWTKKTLNFGKLPKTEEKLLYLKDKTLQKIQKTLVKKTSVPKRKTFKKKQKPFV